MGIRAQKLTIRIWEAQGKCCSICGEKMVPASMGHPAYGWTWDHVWPRARFDYCERGNILVAHVTCNQDKKDRDPTPEEQKLLAKANVVLGYELLTVGEHIGRVRKFLSRRSDLNRQVWSDDVTGPSALAVALEEAMVA
jgi:hypothetical protein